MQKPRRPVSRRSFLKSSAALGTGLALTGPAIAWTRSPGEVLNLACIGVGGMGGSDLGSLASARNVRIAALCDVDANNLGGAAAKHEGARTFTDWRRLFDELGDDIDAVSVSTPDHMHAPIALAAMSLGKHVYCQKPIAQDLTSCRAMARMASEQGVVTQMGTQIHSHAAYRTAVASLRAGLIGKVSEAHLWVSKSWAGPAAGRPAGADEVPAHLDWDLWLGVAPERPYKQGAYHPARWRGWREFGAGTLGDMGCHIFDPVFGGLELGAPKSAVSRGPQHHAETYAADGDIRYVFPGTAQTTDSLAFRWTDGSGASRPDASRAQLPGGVDLPGAGSFLVGDKGVMVIPHWDMPRLYKDGEVMEGVELERRDSRNHYHEWTDACRGEGDSTTPFSFAGPLTEAVLVGTVAGCMKDRELAWDNAGLSFGDEAADALVGRAYREGWRPAGV